MSPRTTASALPRIKPAPDAKGDDRRFAQRKPRSLPAFLLSDRISAAVPAVVRDLSSTGAKIEIVFGRDTPVTSADGLPANMTLYMVSDNIEVDVSLAWRDGNFIGVRFTSMSRVRQKPKVGPRRKRDAPAKSSGFFRFG